MEDRKSYEYLFEEYLHAKSDIKIDSKKIVKLEERLWKFEDPYRTDILLLIRQAIIENFYGHKRIDKEINFEIENIKREKSQSYFVRAKDDKIMSQKIQQKEALKLQR